jgi:monoamine oxidase
MTILIVGAGAAGLTAAYTLKWAGVTDFKILEASSAYLGRVKKNGTFAADFPIDIGGEWIHTDPSSILDTIVDDTECVIDVETTPYKPVYFWWDGTEIYQETLRGMMNDYKFVNYTWYDFFNDWIAVDVLDKILFNCQVTNIDWGNSSSASSAPVNVTCSDGTTKFSADQVIITVPIKVLQDEDINFNPALPADFVEALNTPYMAPGLKVFFKFRTAFYPEAFNIGADCTKEDLEYSESERFFYDVAYGQETSDNILGVVAVGEVAARYVDLSDEEIVQTFLADLDVVFNGAATANFMQSMVQNWNAEPFIRGAYSFYEEQWSAIDTLRKPLNGRLFFAGEAIPIEESNYAHGFVHGAALSGRHAAYEVMWAADKQEGRGLETSSASSCPTHRSMWFLFTPLLCGYVMA